MLHKILRSCHTRSVEDIIDRLFHRKRREDIPDDQLQSIFQKCTQLLLCLLLTAHNCQHMKLQITRLSGRNQCFCHKSADQSSRTGHENPCPPQLFPVDAVICGDPFQILLQYFILCPLSHANFSFLSTIRF